MSNPITEPITDWMGIEAAEFPERYRITRGVVGCQMGGKTVWRMPLVWGVRSYGFQDRNGWFTSFPLVRTTRGGSPKETR